MAMTMDLENAFARSSLVVVSESSNVLSARTALPSLNAGREIFHVASGTYSRLVPQTPEKIAGQLRDKPHLREASFKFPQ